MPLSNDDRLRCIGAAHEDAAALVRVRQEIGSINYHRIDPRHVRKLAERKRVLRPLRDIETWLEARHKSAQAGQKD